MSVQEEARIDTDPDVDAPRTDEPAAPGARPRRGLGVGWLLVAVLVLALVVSGLFAVLTYREHRHDTAQDDDRSSAVRAAEQFALRMDTFDGGELDTYKSRVTAMLTTRAKGQFEQSFPAFEKLYEQSKATSAGTVRAAGVQDADQDSATVLVIHDRLVKSSLGNQQQYLRWKISLDKVGGTWLVDEFEQGS